MSKVRCETCGMKEAILDPELEMIAGDLTAEERVEFANELMEIVKMLESDMFNVSFLNEPDQQQLLQFSKLIWN